MGVIFNSLLSGGVVGGLVVFLSRAYVQQLHAKELAKLESQLDIEKESRKSALENETLHIHQLLKLVDIVILGIL